MNCLTLEQLARLALDLDADDGTRMHVDECPTCRGRLAEMQALGDRLARAHAGFEQDQEQSRAQFMAALEAEDRAPKPAPRRRNIGTWTGGLTMGQKTALGGLGVAAILAAVLLWAPNAPKRVSAMERMAQNIRQAKSYEMTMENEMRFERKPGETVTVKMAQKVYWEAPRSYRMQFSRRQLGHDAGTVEIHPSDKPGIEIDHDKKQFRRRPARRGHISPFMLFEKLGRFSGDADRDLGTQEIDGKAARGFEIDAKKIDPDAYSGPVEIWLDFDTNLPVKIQYKIEASTPGTLTMHDFRWNVELDPKLFDTTPPVGYVDATPETPPLEQQVREISEALVVYAERAGEYPQAKIVYGDVTRDEMYRMIGIKGGRPTPEQTRGDAYVKVLGAMKGFAVLNGTIFRLNPDAAYYGLTVSPQHVDKVLLRWKLDDDRYQVIYGDLRAETVTAERLRELEKQK